MGNARLETVVQIAMSVGEHHQVELGRLVLQYGHLRLELQIFLL